MRSTEMKGLDRVMTPLTCVCACSHSTRERRNAVMQGFETPSQRLRNAIPTAPLSHIQRLARKVEDLRNPHPSTRATSLAVATQAGRLDVVEWLLEQGHDEGEISRDTLGDTIVHIGAAHGSSLRFGPIRRMCRLRTKG